MYLFLIYFIIDFLSTNCNGQYKNPCSVFPKNQFIEAGSGAEITCRSTCVSGKVFWKLNNRRVNESLSHRINSSHTVLVLPYSELQDPSHPTITVECHSVEKKQILGGTTIRTYTKPHSIACISYSDKEMNVGLPSLFTCSWEHQMNSPLKINYSVICLNPDCPVVWREICNSDVTNCIINTASALKNKQISTKHNNTIYVRAKTEAWEANSSSYTFNFLHTFKIPSRKLNVTAHTDHILVEWDCLPQTKVNGQCQVKYKHTKDEATIKVLNKTLKNNLYCKKKEKLTIDEVESCREYSVSVRCGLEHAPWSNWSQEKTVLTKLKKRDVKLDVWRKVSKLQGERKVHILWKGIPPHCQGTFSYRVRQTSYDELTSRENYTETLCGNYSCDITVNQDAHRVNLTVFYNEGFLAEESFYLPADAESETHSLRVDDIETEHAKSGLVVRWKTPSEPVSGYLIDWAYTGNEFDWKMSNFTNTTLDGLVDKKPYNITVTPVFRDKTGPSTHVIGVCSSFADPGIVTILDVETYDKSAHVSWSIKSKDKCSDVVVNYIVFYGTPNGPQFNVTVKDTVQDFYLKNLNPNTQYSVHVVATARTGNAKSNDRLFMTKRFDPRLITVLTVTGSILIILILSLGLFCAILWRKFSEKPVPNPGLSSLALWPQTTLQKAAFPFEPFNTPSESLCDMVYTEEMQQTSMTTGYNSNLTSNQGDLTIPSPQNYERPSLPLKTSHLPCPRESTSLLPMENSPTIVSPYRSQVTIESPPPRTSKQLKRLPSKLQEKTPSYVSLDFLFDQ